MKAAFEQSPAGEVINILRLIRSENVGVKTFYNLCEVFGHNIELILDKLPSLAEKGGKKDFKVCSKEDALKEIDKVNEFGASIVTYKNVSYSRLLKQISSPPPLLTVKGNLKLLNKSSLAVVGARNSSFNGKIFTKNLVKDLIAQDFTIVSGLARGIDTSAHEASVKEGSTIAVLAGGINHIYPEENTKLYHAICENGLIIAELPFNASPKPQNFPQRNRIISGLSLGVIVIEASLKSGSLITAKFALEQNREIFAVPGFPLDPRSQGTNSLIKSGAYLIESAEDVLTNINRNTNNLFDLQNYIDKEDKFKYQRINYADCEKELIQVRKLVAQNLSAYPVEIDSLSLEMNVAKPLLHMVILELELAGKVQRLPGNKIALIYNEMK